MKIYRIPFFLQIQKIFLFLYIGRRFGIEKRAGRPSIVNSSNHFIDMSVLYQINSTLAISRLKHFDTNIVVERVPLLPGLQAV